MYTNFTNPSSEGEITNSHSLDLQYQICAKFMKLTSQKLFTKELDIILQSSQFINKVNDSLMTKDVSSTQESFNLDLINDQEDPFTQPTPSRLLLRKSKSNCSIRRTDSGVSEALKQVQRKCSQKTVSSISSMIGDLRRIKEKTSDHDKLEKELKKMEAKFQIAEEELLILRKKCKDLQQQNKMLQNQLSAAKIKFKQTQQNLRNTLRYSRSNEQIHSYLTVSNPGDKLKKYLQEKEMHLARKERSLKSIQDKIQQSIESPAQIGCDKCCQLIKKLKESILKYRKFLEEEVDMAQTLYNNYKQLLN